MRQNYKAITKFLTVTANHGKKNKHGFVVYVGAYADGKTAIRVKTYLSEFIPGGTTLTEGE